MKWSRWGCVVLAAASFSCSSPSEAPVEEFPDSAVIREDAAAEVDAAPSADAAACVHVLPTCPTPPAMPPSYQNDVAPIIKRACASCHYPGSNISRGVYSTYAELSSSRGTVLDEIFSCRMPEAPIRPLTAADRTTILTWIECGAPNN